ncbi:glycosyltransferase [Leucobacter massiliensis]|uniref:Glycosyltransferase n=1 Tax=Leucobacter massiliensis TaxID=1686285 RepID=A0A2S9QQR6_9MICO|nr:glycosyltransferase [Leucobacter massiliensis]PRI11936.1 glycosyltransferase [Leucobacter massiliensis]
MRYVLAIAVLVLSGVLLLLGIGQRTFLAGPSEISFPVDTKSEAGYAVIDGSEFAKVTGQANVVVRGEQAFVATGATRDVRGWVAPFLHADLTVDAKQQRLLSALVAAAPDESEAGNGAEDGTAGAEEGGAAQGGDAAGATQERKPVDPRGSDLWLEERSIDDAGSGAETGTLRVPVALAEGESVLIAADGAAPVPKDVTLVWVQDQNTPWAGPLLAAGGVLAVVGAVLYLLAVDHDRRGLGPRRGRRGPLQGIRNIFTPRGRRGGAAGAREGEAPVVPEAPEAASGGTQMRALGAGRPLRASSVRGRARVTALPALGIVVALGLSGCSASYWPQFGEQAEEEPAPSPTSSSVAPVPVKDAQLDRIVQRVAAVANEADDELDAAVLEERFTGDALAQRSANYKIRAAKPDYGIVPPRLTDEGLDYELVQSTESWPRTLFVTVASTSGATDAAGDPEPTEGKDSETEPAAASPSLALILTQQSPQENYLVSRVIALRGGISMPQAAPAEEGTALLSNDLETLVLPPGEVGAAFASVLQNGVDGPEAEDFELSDESLVENYGKARAEQAQQKSDADGQDLKFSVAARQGDEPPVALSTGVGGALVATTVIEEQIVEGGRYKPQAQDAVTALSGLEGEQDRLVQEVAHQLLFFVPSKSDGSKIQLLGVTSELVGVRN